MQFICRNICQTNLIGKLLEVYYDFTYIKILMYRIQKKKEGNHQYFLVIPEKLRKTYFLYEKIYKSFESRLIRLISYLRKQKV